MAIAKGVTVGPYEVLAHIGAGGMGDVWRARDRRIGRDVALKVLPEAYAPGDERVLRFEQEARAAGALNHPGLVTIFDVGTMQGSPYIVMELLEGETLRDAIGDAVPKPLPVRRVIDYAIQIASALAVAHDKGIIHRDLKPENIFITSDGRVKILDFGLAKLAADASDADGRNRTGRHLTSSGMVVGTPGYMSPEQVRAQLLDYRTDIFSLGAVLYEMLCGQRAFDRDSAVETMNAVLKDDPQPLAELEPRVPSALDVIVRHCMEKNPRDRFQSAHDLAFQLRLLPEFQHSVTDNLRALPAPAAATKKRPYGLIAAIVAAIALAGAGVALFRARAGGAAAARRTFKQLTFRDGLAMFPTFAPDGKTFAYVSSQTGNRDIYVQRVDGRTATDITADSPDDDSEPAFSPDGSQIAFRSEREGGGIFVMGVTGESVRRLTDFGHNPSWNPDGTKIVIATQRVELRPENRQRLSELWIVDARTGGRQPLVQAGKGGPDFGLQSDAVQPSWSPHGNRIAFWGISDWSGQRDIRTIDPDAPQPKETVVKVTTDTSLHWDPVWSPDGKYLYYGSDRDETLNLWRIPMDEAAGRPTGDPEPVSLPATTSGNFSFSHQGDLVYTAVERSFRLMAFPFDANKGEIGAAQPLFGGSHEIFTYEPSPNHQLIAFTAGSGGRENLFISNADGSRPRQLTNDSAKDRAVVWSRDGKTLYLQSNRDGGAYRLWSVHEDGSRLTRIVDDADLRPSGAKNVYSPNVSPDRNTLAAETDRDDVFVHLDRPNGQRIEPFAKGISAPQWSPDGTRIVGTIDGDASVPPPGIAAYSLRTHKVEKVLDHGVAPQWLPDGNRIVFMEKQSIGILDLTSRQIINIPFTPPQGVELVYTALAPRVSRDGSTLIVHQSFEQGDIWLMHVEKK